jgi:two-component system response regulator ChvI
MLDCMIVRILLVDDDVTLAAILTPALADEGFTVTSARNGVEALRRFASEGADLLILDILMPEMDGLEVCRRIRKQGTVNSTVPIILLSSRGEEVDRVTGLETGADDYLTKPFSTRELVARIRALDRRMSSLAGAAPAALAGDRIEAGPLVLDPARFASSWRGHPVVLTRSEFRLLEALARHRGLVLSRERLLDHARGDDVNVTDRTVDTFVKRLRKKIREVDPDFEAIETVFGLGYRLKE